ncbi:MAG: CD1845 family protein [Oscillospiraceae bacterium]|jgi:multidrug efflux pump subunit AcrB|nr:CD1845 family protein [Oscillospiraceae bacterium]
MRILLKILFAPAIALLALFVWLCMGLLYCSSFVFGIAGSVIALLGLAVLITYSVTNGIILLVIAFLVSPMGLPMAAAWLLAKVQDLRYWIQDLIYG